jgi:hypothetical protein
VQLSGALFNFRTQLKVVQNASQDVDREHSVPQERPSEHQSARGFSGQITVSSSPLPRTPFRLGPIDLLDQ